MSRVALLFYDNPRLLLLLLGLILVGGLTASQVLPRMEDPLMKPRAATIRTVFPGASSERVETLVTDVIERELMELEDIRLIRSGSRSGYSLIALELRDEIEDVEPIWGKIRDKLLDAEVHLPAGVKPEFENLEFRAASLLVSLQWRPETPTEWAILNRLSKELQSELRNVHGTDKVDIYGLPEEQVLIEVSQEGLAAHGLSLSQLAGRLQRADAKVSAGSLQNENWSLLLELSGDFDSMQRLARLPIGPTPTGQMLPLGQVAQIRKTVADPPTDRVLVAGRDAVVLVAYQRHNRRIDLWSADVVEAVQKFRDSVPQEVQVQVDFQQSRYVMRRLTSLLMNLGLGAMAVMLVLLFLMGWRGSLLVGLTLPVTCLAVLTSMWIGNIPLHQMSVTGIILALGLLIDNAIVIVDEVQSALQEGQSVREAIERRVSHLSVPLLGSTLTTALAFAPLILMIGPAAEFVYAISTSVIAAIVSSYFLSMTVLPALMGWLRNETTDPQPQWPSSSTASPPASMNLEEPLAETAVSGVALSGPNEADPNEADPTVAGPAVAEPVRRSPWWLAGWSNPRLSAAYHLSLQWLFRHPLAGLGLGLLLPAVGFALAHRLPEQFFPSADRDQFTIKLELAAGKSLDQTLDVARRARNLLVQDPRIRRVDWYLGRSAPPFYVNLIPLRRDMSNYAQAFVELNDGVADQQFLQDWQDRLQLAFPMARVNVQQLQLGPPLDDPIEIRIFGPDPDVLIDLGDRVREVLSSIEYVTATHASLGTSTGVLTWQFDPLLLEELDLDRATLAQELSWALDGVMVGAILDGGQHVPVHLRLSAEDRDRPAAIASMTVNRLRQDLGQGRPSRESIPLSALGSWWLAPSDTSVQRINNRRVNEVHGQVETGRLASVVLAEFQQALAGGAIDLPPGYSIRYGGESEERDRAVTNLLSTAPVLVLLMFSIIVLSFGSFRAALMVGCVGALSIGLGLFSLTVFGFPFGFMAIVGTMGLVGLAINDSIVVLAGLMANPQARAGQVEAIVDVVRHSTRHIVATSLTTVAGFTPLLIQGGGFWPPLAIAIAGGVGGATILALYFVPALFLLSLRLRSLRSP